MAVLDAGLRADAAPRELDRSRGKVVRVVVPLERVEALGQTTEEGVACCSLGRLDRVPPDLELLRGPHSCVSRLRKQLRTETDAEHRNAQVDQALEEEVLVAQPRVMAILVRVHRPAEDEDGEAGGREPGISRVNRDRRRPRALAAPPW